MKYQTKVSTKTTMFLVACLFFLSGCASLITAYNERAYEYATSLKVESLALLDDATEPYSKHQYKAEQLQMDLNKAHEYVKGVDLNEESAAQWAIVSNPDENSIAGLLKRWKKNNVLGIGFVEEVKPKIAAGFDEIIKLESRKLKSPHLL